MSSLTQLSAGTSEGSPCVNSLRVFLFFFLIRARHKEGIWTTKKRGKEGGKERERANRWSNWQGPRHTGSAETRLERVPTPEASLTCHRRGLAAGTSAITELRSRSVASHQQLRWLEAEFWGSGVWGGEKNSEDSLTEVVKTS